MLSKCGAKPTHADPCLYSIVNGEELTLITVYVDDIVIASTNENTIEMVIRKLSSKFKVKDMGDIGYCLGIEFSRSKDKIVFQQKGFVKDLLERFSMKESNAVNTPLDPNAKLVKPTEPATEEETKLPYRELVGALTYLSVATRPDISYAVSYLGQFNSCYRRSHWTAAKRVLRYLKGTADLGIVYSPVKDCIKGYADADWAGCVDDRRSYTGFTFTFSEGPISWDSRKQRTVALSTTEAEYMSLSEAAKECIYLRSLMMELRMHD